MIRALFPALLIVLPFLPRRGLRPMSRPPSLADKVKGGELPPVADRLPADPRVIDLPAMGRQPGKQGGTISSVIGSQKDIRFMSIYGYARLVGYDEKLQLVPDILDKFTVEDGRIFTLTLRKGHKWSDGQPVTTEDFRYGYEDVMLNEDLKPGGLPTELCRRASRRNSPSSIDVTTIRYSRGPNPNFLPALAAPLPPAILLPAHYLKQFHKKYQDKEKLEELIKKDRSKNWRQLHIRVAASTGRRTPSCRRSTPGGTPPNRRPSSSSSTAIPISTGSTPPASSSPMSTSSCSTPARPAHRCQDGCRGKRPPIALYRVRGLYLPQGSREAGDTRAAVGAHPGLAGGAVPQPELPGPGMAEDLP